MICIFCEIVAGRSAASVFYEDERLLGLMTIGPVNEGHAMVIPKRHAADLSEPDEETGRQLWTVTQRAAAAIRASGIRFVGDPFKVDADWSVKPAREVLDRAAAQIRRAYEKLFGAAPLRAE